MQNLWSSIKQTTQASQYTGSQNLRDMDRLSVILKFNSIGFIGRSTMLNIKALSSTPDLAPPFIFDR